jgi:hypothetical protein
MTIATLIQKLQERPDQETHVNWVVFEKETNRLVTVSLEGTKAIEVMKVLARKTAAKGDGCT